MNALFPKQTHDIYGKPIKKRNNFKISTKKIEWNRAADRADDDFKKTSKCRQYSKCGTRFIWGNRAYNFDHYDNNAMNNSQKNCKLLCATCHGKSTKTGKRAIKFLGHPTGRYKTIKHKVGYKKPKKIKKAKARKKRPLTFEEQLRKQLSGL